VAGRTGVGCCADPSALVARRCQDGTRSPGFGVTKREPSGAPLRPGGFRPAGVDPARIYVSSWSNGARFAALYAFARHDEGTPGGHRVADGSGIDYEVDMLTFLREHPRP